MNATITLATAGEEQPIHFDRSQLSKETFSRLSARVKETPPRCLILVQSIPSHLLWNKLHFYLCKIIYTLMPLTLRSQTGIMCVVRHRKNCIKVSLANNPVPSRGSKLIFFFLFRYNGKPQKESSGRLATRLHFHKFLCRSHVRLSLIEEKKVKWQEKCIWIYFFFLFQTEMNQWMKLRVTRVKGQNEGKKMAPFIWMSLGKHASMSTAVSWTHSRSSWNILC